MNVYIYKGKMLIFDSEEELERKKEEVDLQDQEALRRLGLLHVDEERVETEGVAVEGDVVATLDEPVPGSKVEQTPVEDIPQEAEALLQELVKEVQESPQKKTKRRRKG